MPSHESDDKSIAISFARSASPSFSIARKRLNALAEHSKLTVEKEDRGNVFTIATTNRPHEIAPALRRPGRFDRIIHMNLPSESPPLCRIGLSRLRSCIHF